MSGKKLFFYTSFVVFVGAGFFLWLYLRKQELFIDSGDSPWDLAFRVLPFCLLTQLAIFLSSWIHFHLLQWLLGKKAGELQVVVARYGTLGFALLVEAAFLITARNIGPNFLEDLAYTIPAPAFAVFLVTLFAAKYSALKKGSTGGKAK